MTVEAVGADKTIDAAEAGKDAGAESGANMDNGAATRVAVAADGLIIVEGATRHRCRGADLIADGAPLGDANLDDIGSGGGGVIAADGLGCEGSLCPRR